MICDFASKRKYSVAIWILTNNLKLNLLNYKLLCILGILPFRFNAATLTLELDIGCGKRWLYRFWIAASAAHIFGIGTRCVRLLLQSTEGRPIPEHYIPGSIFFTVGLIFIFSAHLCLTSGHPEIEAIVFSDIVRASSSTGSGRKVKKTLSEQLIRIMPLNIQSCVVAPLILYLTDPNFPGLLYSTTRCLGENVITYFLSIALDTIFFTTYLNYAYNYYFLILSFINLFHGEVDEAVQTGLGQGMEWSPVAITKTMRKYQLQVQLFNHGFAHTIFATKLMSLFNAILGGFMAIRFFHSNFPLAFAFFTLAIEAVLLYVIVYDKAFDLPERMKALDRLIDGNVARHGYLFKRNEHRVLVNSFNLKGINVGGFHTFERESTPKFIDHIATQILSLLLSVK